jgi:hypothetical protein
MKIYSVNKFLPSGEQFIIVCRAETPEEAYFKIINKARNRVGSLQPEWSHAVMESEFRKSPLTEIDFSGDVAFLVAGHTPPKEQ